ncbi:hypothetical protein FRC02_000855 [Tulasnella sp. 418]|nr:hypothetical protein FRC02_000855 [Tulasnella sp. 418]
MIRSIIMTVIKYKEGYAAIPGHGYIPKPYQLWHSSSRRWIFPAQLLFSIAWSLEIVAHLEELCFWLFLTRISPIHLGWFRSWHFRSWLFGSVIAVAGMPLVAILTRNLGLKSEAYIFLAGSSGSLFITVAFIYVLLIFPRFLRRVKNEGAGQEVVIRLQTFNQLNIIRVCFRFFFVVPFFIMAIDGVLPHNPINESALWTDLLACTAGIGCVVSSVITLLIFFPRSMQREAGYPSRNRSTENQNDTRQFERSYYNSPNQDRANPFSTTSEPGQITSQVESRLYATKDGLWELEEVKERAEQIKVPVQFKYPQYSKRRTSVHPLILNYRSPLDVVDHNERYAYR